MTAVALLAAILDDPQDDAARLVYADWLEEHGEGERAEFIRVQIELARLEVPAIFRRHEPLLAIYADAVQNFAELSRVKDLRSREKELLDGWTPAGDVRNWAAWSGDTLVRITGVTVPVFRRGFVAEISCDLADWIRFGPAIVRAQPVEVVRISDRRPWNSGNRRWGFSSHLDDAEYGGDWWILPREIWVCCHKSSQHFNTTFRRWWKTEPAAVDALSAGCILYAKTLDPTPTQP